jgi:hypothetical protein
LATELRPSLHAPRGIVRTSGLLHRAALVALALWCANDYLLKDAYPGLVTSKLSDVTGLVVVPLVLAALVGVGLPGRIYPRVVDIMLIACGIAFTLVKLSEPANGALEWILGVMQRSPQTVVRDATDLVALPMLAVSRWCYRTARRRDGELP